MLNIDTAGTSGLTLTIMITSVRQPPRPGRASLPSNAMLIVLGGNSIMGTAVGTSVPVEISVKAAVTVGRSPCSGGTEVGFGVGVSVRVAVGVQVGVGVQVAGRPEVT